MQLEELKKLFKTHKEDALFGRYIHTKTIKPLLEKHVKNFDIKVIGQSILKENIYSIKIGSGKQKVFMWSQMHGNESTTTKAIFDILNVFTGDNDFSKTILKECSILIIPILNPDGAKAYTRLNANGIDLNRDAQDLTQSESNVLRNVFNSFKPNFCFNLHGQRTIFSAGNTNNVATISFLSPAQDKACSITKNRKIAMSLVNDMNNMLQQEIPNQIGVYDDAFNLNCVGDTFQTLNVPTVLFEAGHYKNDYDREQVRRFIFQSLVIAIESIAAKKIAVNAHKAYSVIPENKKLFFDIIIKNAKIDSKIVDIAIQYEERLIGASLKFIPKIKKIERLDDFFAHKIIDANNNAPFNFENNVLLLGNEIDFVIIDTIKYSLKVK